MNNIRNVLYRREPTKEEQDAESQRFHKIYDKSILLDIPNVRNYDMN